LTASPAKRVVAYVGPAFGRDRVAEVLGDTVEVTHVAETQAAVAAALRTVDAYVDASTWVPVTAEMLTAAPRLRAISLASTGDEHVDRDAAERAGVAVHTLQDRPELIADLTPTAEHAWALVLACARRLRAATADVCEGRWDRQRFEGTMLNGRRLGVVGCGRLGQWVARYGRAFGMDVVGHDPLLTEWPDHIRRVGLDELFATSDVISLHAPMNDDTRALVGHSLLAEVRPGAILVNTSRGGLIDDDALIEALASGRLAAAGLDVLRGEPFVADHPLVAYARDHDELVITPHLGGYVPEAVRYACELAARRLVEVLADAEHAREVGR
jgi:phosphoglycerate dehydrogenase-like enzyme